MTIHQIISGLFVLQTLFGQIPIASADEAGIPQFATEADPNPQIEQQCAHFRTGTHDDDKDYYTCVCTAGTLRWPGHCGDYRTEAGVSTGCATCPPPIHTSPGTLTPVPVPPAREVAPAAPVPVQPAQPTQVVVQREVVETPIHSAKDSGGGGGFGITNDMLIGGLVGAAIGFGAGYLAFHQSTPQYPYGYPPPGGYPGQSPWQQSPFLGQVPGMGMGGAMGQFPGFSNFGFQGGLRPISPWSGFGGGYPAPGITPVGLPGAGGFVGGGSPLGFSPYGGGAGGLSGFGGGQTAPAVLPYMH